MRTTVEMTDEQYQALQALAARRGLRGFSPLVQEAIELYLQARRDEALEAALSLRGWLDESEAGEVRRRIEEAWGTWRAG